MNEERVVDSELAEIPEIPEILESVLLAALNEARERLEADEEVVPFTALAVGETLFIETHPAEEVEQCFNAARHTVQNAKGAAAYALCYDGYVDTDAGMLDALIAEGGIPGEPEGYAIGCVYEWDEESEEPPRVTTEPVYIGPAPNYMEFAVDLPDEEAEEDADESALEDDSEDGAAE